MVGKTTRMERAQDIESAAVTMLSESSGWVESQSDATKTYTVELGEGGEASCTCPDHRYRGVNCKHIAAVAREAGRFDL